MGENKSIDGLLPLYFKSVQKRSNYNGRQHILGICRRFGINYKEKDNEYLIASKDYMRIQEMLHIRLLYTQNSISLYSTIETAKVLNTTKGHVTNLAEKGTLNLKSIIGKSYYFDQKEIDEIVQLLSDTIGLKEMTKITREKTRFTNFPRYMTRRYYVRHFDPSSNPIDASDLRIERTKINRFIKFVEENYTPLTKREDYLSFFLKMESKENIKYVEELSNKHELIDKTILGNWYKKKYVLNKSGKKGRLSEIIPHVISVCKEINIEWFANKEFDNIYIWKKDNEKYLEYYDFMRGVVTSGNYYLNTDVQKMFRIRNTEGVASYAGSESFGGRRFIKKDKVDELHSISKNTVAITELAYELGIKDRMNLFKTIKELNIEIIDGLPLGRSKRIEIKNADSVKSYYRKEEKLKKAKSEYERFQILINNHEWRKKHPRTFGLFQNFAKSRLNMKNSTSIQSVLVSVSNVILSNLEKEIAKHDDSELKELYGLTQVESYRREFTYFLNFCQSRVLTKYKGIYKNKNHSPTKGLEPYSIEQWTKFGKLLFNANELIYEELLTKALQKRLHAMVWLYCSMHYVSGWRAGDIQQKIPFPPLETILGMDEEMVIESIRNRDFTLAMAQSVVNYVMDYIWKYQQKPGKLESRDNATPLKLVVGNNYVFQIGLLIALCEAHRRVLEKSLKPGKANFKMLVTQSATNKIHQKSFFGERFEDIFNGGHFKSQKAIKTQMNIIQNESQKKRWEVGYKLGSIFRSHTTNRQGIAPTTQVYLDHINKNDSIDEITYGLFERGTFGFMPYLMLDILSNGKDISKLDLLEQNTMIKELVPFAPNEIERLTKSSALNQNKVKAIMKELLISDKEDMLNILEKISKGTSPSKMEHSQCLLKCIDSSYCIAPQRTECLGCDFLVPELYFLQEFKLHLSNILDDIEESEKDFDKQRYSHLLVSVYLPILQQAIRVFGKERVDSFISGSALKNKMKDLNRNNQLILG